MSIAFVKDNKVLGTLSFFAGEVSYGDPDAVQMSCPDWVKSGDDYIDGQFISVTVAPPAPKVSPVEFKLLFTPQERVAIKAARQTDPVIDDFYDIVEDPRLTAVDLGLNSTVSAIQYLESKGLIASGRAEKILSGTLV